MLLELYLESRNIQHKEFAKMLEVCPHSITNYITRKRLPTLVIGRKIEKLTKGKVSIDDLIEHWEKGDRANCA